MRKVLFFSYSAFLLCFSLFSYIFVDANLFYLHRVYSGFSVSNRSFTSVIFILLVILFFLFYLVFFLNCKKGKLLEKDLKVLLGSTVAFLFFSYPGMLSFDIFNYIASAKTFFFYQENPYIIMPIEFIGDPLLQFTRAANKIALYGPSWILASWVPYALGFGNFLLTLFNFKLFILFFYIATITLIWKISKNIYSVTFFALNPLVVIETLVSSHNDIFMVFFALLAFYLLKDRKLVAGLISFIVSIFVKYATFFLMPVFAYVLWKILRKSKIYWTYVFYSSSLFMTLAFFLSPLREEIYPWYAIWFLVFVSLVPQKRWLTYFSIALSFGLLLRYVPFMLLGTYFGITPFIRELVTFVPLVIIGSFWLWKKSFLKNT